MQTIQQQGGSRRPYNKRLEPTLHILQHFTMFVKTIEDMEGIKLGISQQIKEARIKKSLTQKELGAKIGVSESAVARYESGTLNMSTEVLYKIANAMSMDLKIILIDK